MSHWNEMYVGISGLNLTPARLDPIEKTIQDIYDEQIRQLTTGGMVFTTYHGSSDKPERDLPGRPTDWTILEGDPHGDLILKVRYGISGGFMPIAYHETEIKFSTKLQKGILEKPPLVTRVLKKVFIEFPKTIKLIADNITRREAYITAAFTAFMTNATLLMGATARRPGLGGEYALKPEAIVGPVPLFSIQGSERAKSDRKLKTRALGDVFLAHQKGNQDMLRLDVTLKGPTRYLYLWTLIQIQGSSEGKSMNITEGNINFSDELTEMQTKTGAKTNALNYEQHQTFPIITQFQILLNMYLQTIEWHRTVEDGQDVFKVHLLFRKWIPPSNFYVWNKMTGDGEAEIMGNTGYGFDKGKLGAARKWLEFGIDATWKMMRMYGEVMGHFAIGSDGSTKEEIDQESLSSLNKLLVGYTGGLFKLW